MLDDETNGKSELDDAGEEGGEVDGDNREDEEEQDFSDEAEEERRSSLWADEGECSVREEEEKGTCPAGVELKLTDAIPPHADGSEARKPLSLIGHRTSGAVSTPVSKKGSNRNASACMRIYMMLGRYGSE